MHVIVPTEVTHIIYNERGKCTRHDLSLETSCYFLSPHHPNAPHDRVKKVKPYEMKTTKERN